MNLPILTSKQLHAFAILVEWGRCGKGNYFGVDANTLKSLDKLGFCKFYPKPKDRKGWRGILTPEGRTAFHHYDSARAA